MNSADFAQLMIEDLGREYKHMLFYTYASSAVRGLHRLELGEFFKEQASSEMNHIKMFSDTISAMFGITATPVINYDFAVTSLLDYACKMEEEVTNFYIKRFEQLKTITDMSDVDKYYLQLFYEDQLQDSKSDLNEIKLILGAK